MYFDGCSALQVAAEGKMCIMPLDLKRALALSVPGALKIFLAPGAGLAQAVRAGLPPTTKEPQVQQAIQAATADAEKAKVSPCVHLLVISPTASLPQQCKRDCCLLCTSE